MDTSKVIPLIQRALNLMETSAIWDRKAAMKAHKVGLQGEKRRLRYLSREAGFIVDKLMHCTWDLFWEELEPQNGSVDMKTLIDRPSVMTGIIDKQWKVYEEMHAIANELVMAKLRVFAKPLYCYADKLLIIIEELHRARTEYEWAKWEYHHISRYQLAWCNVHDEYEEKEESQGYKDDND